METFAVTQAEKLQEKKVRQNINKVRRTFFSYCQFLAKFYSPYFDKTETQIIRQLQTICLESLQENMPNEDNVHDFNSELDYLNQVHKVFKSYLNKSFRLSVLYVRSVYINKSFAKKNINEKEFYGNIRALMERKGIMFEFAKNNSLIQL